MPKGENNSQKTHCPKGHAYSADNTRYYQGGRRCTICSTGRTAARRARNQNVIRTFLAVPCVDCGVSYPFWIMTFDHLPAYRKEFTIGESYHLSLKRLIDEVAKCEVVCANCHAERTYRRRHAEGNQI